MKRNVLSCLASMLIAGFTAESRAEDDLFSLSLKELIQVKVYTASKTQEQLSQTPLSTSVLTREQISRSAANNLPESLRLLPGMIVREQSSGIYDVHIRGLDNAPPGGLFPSLSNTVSLIMIDNEPHFNYFNGGTFWETLPVSIQDIERIELVRGPSSALYGPNALSGVIHIFTKRDVDESNYQTHARWGNYGEKFGHFSVQRRLTDSEYYQLSLKQNRQDRYQSLYYGFSDMEYLPAKEINSAISGSVADRNPDTDLADDTFGTALKFYNAPGSEWQHDISLAYVNSETQKIFTDISISTLTTYRTETSHFNANLNHEQWFFHSGFQKGKQEAIETSYDFDFQNLNLFADHIVSLGDLESRIGIGYQEQIYEGRIINGKHSISDASLNTRLDWKDSSGWRAIMAGRLDHYSTPDTTEPSYQIILNKQLFNTGLARALYSRAHRSPFFEDNHIFVEVSLPFGRFITLGNQSLKLVETQHSEIGYRQQLNESLGLEIEAFHVIAENFTRRNLTNINNSGPVPVSTFLYENTPTKVKQRGATLSVYYEVSNALLMNGFISWQKTRIENLTGISSVAFDTPISFNHGATPEWYGGATMQKQLAPQWNLFSSIYTMKSHQQWRNNNRFDIPDVWLVDTKISHQFTPDLSLSISAKNLGADEQQFAFADKIDARYQLSADLSL